MAQSTNQTQKEKAVDAQIFIIFLLELILMLFSKYLEHIGVYLCTRSHEVFGKPSQALPVSS